MFSSGETVFVCSVCLFFVLSSKLHIKKMIPFVVVGIVGGVAVGVAVDVVKR